MVHESKPLLRVAIHEPDWVPSLLAVCAGYEKKSWRAKALAHEMFDWLPSFALPWSEQQTLIGSQTAVTLLRNAAEVVYKTDKYGKRGEFGELLLHGILLQEFGTEPAVSKFWFKDSKNDTVKGFDVVHITDSDNDDLHLWLGEAKFYSDLQSAVRDAFAALKEHLDSDYLRSEFMLVSNKIDPLAPYAARLRRLLHHNTSLDEVFSVLHVPVLLTYESKALAAHEEHTEEYFADLRAEVEKGWRAFAKDLGEIEEVVVHLILVPLGNKELLTKFLHERLQAWQQI